MQGNLRNVTTAKDDRKKKGVTAKDKKSKSQKKHGRFGDTEMAHVEKGEVVVPLSVQSPKVMTTLHQGFEEQGMPMSRYTVSSSDNSKNPSTKKTEYFSPEQAMAAREAHNRLTPQRAGELEAQIANLSRKKAIIENDNPDYMNYGGPGTIPKSGPMYLAADHEKYDKADLPGTWDDLQGAAIERYGKQHNLMDALSGISTVLAPMVAPMAGQLVGELGGFSLPSIPGLPGFSDIAGASDNPIVKIASKLAGVISPGAAGVETGGGASADGGFAAGGAGASAPATRSDAPVGTSALNTNFGKKETSVSDAQNPFAEKSGNMLYAAGSAPAPGAPPSYNPNTQQREFFDMKHTGNSCNPKTGRREFFDAPGGNLATTIAPVGISVADNQRLKREAAFTGDFTKAEEWQNYARANPKSYLDYGRKAESISPNFTPNVDFDLSAPGIQTYGTDLNMALGKDYGYTGSRIGTGEIGSGKVGIDYFDLNPGNRDKYVNDRRIFDSGYSYNSQNVLPGDWNEAQYLKNNPGVAASVTAGKFTSGGNQYVNGGKDAGLSYYDTTPEWLKKLQETAENPTTPTTPATTPTAPSGDSRSVTMSPVRTPRFRANRRKGFNMAENF